MNIGGSPAYVHRSLVAKAGRESAFGALIGVSEEQSLRSVVAADEEANLPYISRVLGLSAAIPTFQKRMLVEGGSVITGSPFDIPVWSSLIRGWCLKDSNRLRLLFRASRDGFSFEKFRRAVGWTTTTTIVLASNQSSGAIKSGSEENAVNCCGDNSSSLSFGACFGNHAMRVNFHPTTGCTLSVSWTRETYDVDGESTFLYCSQWWACPGRRVFTLS
ncbi:unnamed protein product [Ectocarpus sp. CCAP 1310/34]|nr:unnamed protein product [Ectocarpus sp. CCAP 1310/34]